MKRKFIISALHSRMCICYFITGTTMKDRNKTTVNSISSTLKALPYCILSGYLTEIYGQFNSSVSTTCETKKELEKLTSLYDLIDLFSLNAT